MIEKDTLYQVYRRDGGRCVICGAKKVLEIRPHHCFYKSEYFREDKNDAWNLVTICMISDKGGLQKEGCHRKCHIGGDRWIQKVCKKIALARYKGKHKDELLKIMKRKLFL